MGSSFALALKQARPDVTVVGSDRNPLVVRKALDRGIVASANTDLSVVEMADLVGGHPMCGKETSGIDHAEADLFEHAPWVVTRDDAWITELVEAVGAHPV